MAAREALLALALVVLTIAPAGAGVVTLCNSDTQGGPGAPNLQTAVAAGGDVTFQCAPGAVIHLTQGHSVTRDVRVNGGNRVTLDGGDHVMFIVSNGVSLRFSDITLQNGHGSRDQHGGHLPDVRGGVVSGNGRVEFLRATVSESDDAIWLDGGSVRILASRIVDNRGVTVQAPVIEIGDRTQVLSNSGTPVRSTGGSVTIVDAEFASNGTSEFSNCTLAVRRATFNAHLGVASGGALRINCDASIEKSEFHNNQAEHGGAIAIGPDSAEISMRRVEFVGNIARQTGGAIAVEPSARPLTVALRSCRFENNRAAQGGAIKLERFSGTTRFLQGSAVMFRQNTASGKGGAIFAINAAIRIVRGAFVGNEAVDGGGAVYATHTATTPQGGPVQGTRTAEFANSLFAHNRSTKGGSAFQGGAAIFTATTIASNHGIAVWPEAALTLPFGGNPPTTFPIRFVNTILLGGTGAPCGPAIARAPFVDGGHTLQFPGTTCGGTIPSAHPALGPLFVPWPWSPALNAGDNAVCQAAPIGGRDIYGVKRPLLDRCAIGAAEGDIPRVITRWLRRDPEIWAWVRAARSGERR